jgi:prevent-host-death family protein
MNITATMAKNRFGQVLEAAQRGPVLIEKAGRPHSVVLSVAQYEALLQPHARGSAGEPGQRFYAEYKDWVDAHNRLVSTHGVFGAEWRAW